MKADHAKALQLASAGQWEASHRCVQAHEDPFSCAIHAYLHRVEGDDGNAAYWYRRAGEQPSTLSPEGELAALQQRLAQAD